MKLRAYLAVFWSSGGQNDLGSGGHIKKNDHREIIHQMAYSTENPKISRFAIINSYYLDTRWEQIKGHSHEP